MLKTKTHDTEGEDNRTESSRRERKGRGRGRRREEKKKRKERERRKKGKKEKEMEEEKQEGKERRKDRKKKRFGGSPSVVRYLSRSSEYVQLVVRGMVHEERPTRTNTVTTSCHTVPSRSVICKRVSEPWVYVLKWTLGFETFPSTSAAPIPYFSCGLRRPLLQVLIKSTKR